MRRTERVSVAIAFGLLASVAPLAAQPEIVVSPAGPLTSVGEAVRAAPAGATIRIRAGVYAEPAIIIERPLTLVGEPGAILDGRGDTGILTIRAENVTVRNLTFRNIATSFVEDRAAIRVADTRDCAIIGNRLDDTFFGIYIENSEDCRIEGNVLAGTGERESAAGNGIHAWHSRRITIVGNRVSGHRDGVYFEFVEDSRVEANYSAENYRYGLHFMFSNGCHYTDNVFVENGAGVAVMYTRNVIMRGNAFERNRGTATYGLLLKDITDSEITDNRFIGNTIGLLAEGSNRIAVGRNLFRDNGWAVKVMANAVANRFTDNLFTGNTFDVATNSRRANSTFERNYWDSYPGYDLDGDGFGDVPFRPVRLFSLVIEKHPPALALLRGLFIQILDAAERVLPLLTPETLVDAQPRITPTGAGPAPDPTAAAPRVPREVS